ncbi:MAG: acetyl-CoA carboxylase biotin carboxyl carrier protein [Gaiellaceae bacterium]
MNDADKSRSAPDTDLIRSVWEEARELIKRLEGSTVQRFSVEAGNTKIEIERGLPPVVAGSVAALAAAPATDDAGPAEVETGHAILSPLVGTFYRSSQPGADAFVQEGDVVDAGQIVGIVEAMKLMNQVPADIGGTIKKILASDGDWVEFEQALMIIEPLE